MTPLENKLLVRGRKMFDYNMFNRRFDRTSNLIDWVFRSILFLWAIGAILSTALVVTLIVVLIKVLQHYT